MKPITESHIEQSAIETLQAQGWAYVKAWLNINIKTNTQQIRTLTGVRDELLPKVMSGEVRVGGLT